MNKKIGKILFDTRDLEILAKCFNLATETDFAFNELYESIHISDNEIHRLYEKAAVFLKDRNAALRFVIDGQGKLGTRKISDLRILTKDITSPDEGVIAKSNDAVFILEYDHLPGQHLVETMDREVSFIVEYDEIREVLEKDLSFTDVKDSGLRVTVEEQAGLEDNGPEDQLYVVLYNHSREEEVESVPLQESVFTTDEMTKAMFNDFLSIAVELAQKWNADLDIQVKWEDYSE